jgi:hypothetical protein
LISTNISRRYQIVWKWGALLYAETVQMILLQAGVVTHGFSAPQRAMYCGLEQAQPRATLSQCKPIELNNVESQEPFRPTLYPPVLQCTEWTGYSLL